jgi:UDP-N-acetylglucosamine 2-epimerase (non-hydrolysing)
VKKVMTIFGTRPEAIKLAPVIREFRKYPNRFRLIVTVTAQHREMLDQVLRLFQIVPDYDLDIMRPVQTTFEVTARALTGLEPILKEERPDLVLVQGDTTTVMAAALAAFYLKIPVGHVEAGLRTYNKSQPFPEEMNRRLVSHIADWHFAPTETARQNLLREGIVDERIFVTGNTVIDALMSVVRPGYMFAHPVLSQINFAAHRLILVTAHRRENWGEPMRHICRAIRQVVRDYPEVVVIFSVHMNPEVQQVVRVELAGLARVHLLEPLDYEPFVQLMNCCYLILTDSGGIQEEAPSLGKPVLVLRNVTERPEGVAAGTLRVVGTETASIVAAAENLLNDPAACAKMAGARNPYGDGQASQRIVRAIAENWGLGWPG